MSNDDLHSASRGPAAALSLAHQLRYALSRQWRRMTAFGRQSRRLGRWLEDNLLPSLREAAAESIELSVEPSGALLPKNRRAGDTPAGLTDCPDLCVFLKDLGIQRLEVDTRLESNQVVDLFMLLAACRRALATRGAGRPRAEPARSLCRPEGLHFNCMQICLQDDALIVRYSYCATRLSMAVRWFERRHRHLGDHRALFRAAPRYGLLAAGLSLLVLLGVLLTGSMTFFVVATVVEAAIMFLAVYVFLRGMGSIEYDNEEQAYRLARAHATLERYAERIRRDLDLAREVQRKLLPEAERMPLPGRIAWASSFIPETQVGGDYFDAADLGDGRAALVFADVSGHGMAAALVTVIVKMAFQECVRTKASLAAFVRQVNRDLCSFTSDGSFVVLVAALVDPAAGRFRYVNCGHNPPPFFLPADGAGLVQGLPPTGAMVLGVKETIDVEEGVQPLAAGDKVLFVTDGVIEARDDDGRFYGGERLGALLDARHTRPVAELANALADDLEVFTRGAEQNDDRTILAFEVR